MGRKKMQKQEIVTSASEGGYSNVIQPGSYVRLLAFRPPTQNFASEYMLGLMLYAMFKTLFSQNET